MKLLTKALRKRLPPLYSQEDVEDPLVVVKFFHPATDWTWYAIEFDGADLFFGLVSGFDVELGYFSLSELSSVKGRLGLGVERDLYFEPQRLSEIRAQVDKLRGGR